jgi:4-diphosphocytidyl-2-C-methyl-D-erythritol kinase
VSQRTITIPAFAKINWSLHVLGKRADGYHEIDTILQTISLHDTLTVEQTVDAEIRLWCDDRSIPGDETNLVWRAAEALRERYSINDGVKINLEKRIPSEAGLGGGSADGGATLLGLITLWGLGISHNDLAEIASQLGSDVPFVLVGGTSRATGRGEMIEPLQDAPEHHLVVIKPNANISTTKAYEALNSRTLTSSDAKPILLRSQASDVSV